MNSFKTIEDLMEFLFFVPPKFKKYGGTQNDRFAFYHCGKLNIFIDKFAFSKKIIDKNMNGLSFNVINGNCSEIEIWLSVLKNNCYEKGMIIFKGHVD